LLHQMVAAVENCWNAVPAALQMQATDGRSSFWGKALLWHHTVRCWPPCASNDVLHVVDSLFMSSWCQGCIAVDGPLPGCQVGCCTDAASLGCCTDAPKPRSTQIGRLQ
jgi:hypothetical protein